MNLTELQELAQKLVKLAAAQLPGATNAEKRAYATAELYKAVEAVDDKVVLLGDWVKQLGGVKLVDNAVVDTLEQWICEQIIRIAWVSLQISAD